MSDRGVRTCQIPMTAPLTKSHTKASSPSLAQLPGLQALQVCFVKGCHGARVPTPVQGLPTIGLRSEWAEGRAEGKVKGRTRG